PLADEEERPARMRMPKLGGDSARVPARAVVEGQRNEPAAAAPAVDRCTEPSEPLHDELSGAAAGTRFVDDRGCGARGEDEEGEGEHAPHVPHTASDVCPPHDCVKKRVDVLLVER